ncbi:ABC transporter permease [Planotetraspora thailandica]|uniref:ABC transporter permease n=1 Tax=Planotetraspora thailandica TaxID=487172 RepID=A0A8J3V039_9ACTN|nr:ABC transporter permease [Planotetraspora thailandica]GII52591.1 ABC transporter permease [Planotetraspora thailandica]
MTRYLLRRIVETLAVLLLLSACVYAVFYVLPGDPARLICGKICLPDQLTAIHQKLGLDQPLWEQYLHFLQGLVAGRDYSSGPSVNHCPAPCLGYSFQTDQPVTGLLLDRLPVSLSLTLGAAVLWLVIGVGTGLVSGLRPGSLADRALTAVALAGTATPVFVLGLVLLLVFCVYLAWLPFPGYVPLTEDPVAWAQNLLLPWLTLALTTAVVYSRLTRTTLLEILAEDHIRTLRAYGVPERRIIGRHALRGTLTPIITLFGLHVGTVLGSTVLTESLFGLPGLGKLLIDAVNTIDVPVVVGATLLSGFAIVVGNTLADLLYHFADPRVHLT